ncbi:MAG: hypothetical protein K2H13_09100 [Eubacterium sp.]|nr:hypothetical protein [Eubacterium sp.]MDE6156240.1 hypothetical protein [Eubacterium sp.]MDE6766574.1 hypothetical protein [Eubacterium sp.]
MICNKCGQTVSDEMYYCENCGEPLKQTYNQQPINNETQNTQSGTQNYSQAYQQPYHQAEQQTYQQPSGQAYSQQYQQYPPYGQPVTPQAFDFMLDNKIDEVKTLGIIAIIAGLFFPIAGIILGCIGISKLNGLPVSPQYGYEKDLKRKKAKNLCMTGIILPIALWVVTFLFIMLVWGIILGGMAAGGLAAAGEFALIM